MIRGLSIIKAKGFPNNKGVHAVPINETPDIAMIGRAVRSNFLINVVFTYQKSRKHNFRESKVQRSNWQTNSEQTALVGLMYR